jgi:hypothetical protein
MGGLSIQPGSIPGVGTHPAAASKSDKSNGADKKKSLSTANANAEPEPMEYVPPVNGLVFNTLHMQFATAAGREIKVSFHQLCFIE